MKYIQNIGRYAISFAINKNGRDVKIELDKRRIYKDTGNIATNGITPVEDEDFEELKKIKRFNNMMKAGELLLTEKSEIETAEVKVADLERENAELRALVEANSKAKELKEKDETIANLKAQLEALSKDEAKQSEAPTEAPKEDSTEAPKTDTEGF